MLDIPEPHAIVAPPLIGPVDPIIAPSDSAGTEDTATLLSPATGAAGAQPAQPLRTPIAAEEASGSPVRSEPDTEHQGAALPVFGADAKNAPTTNTVQDEMRQRVMAAPLEVDEWHIPASYRWPDASGAGYRLYALDSFTLCDQRGRAVGIEGLEPGTNEWWRLRKGRRAYGAARAAWAAKEGRAR